MSMRSRSTRGPKPGAVDDEAEVDVEKTIAKMLWKNHRLFPPTSNFKNNWDTLMLTFVFYNCIFVPAELCFGGGKASWWQALDYVIDTTFLIDIVLNFRTAYYDDNFEMVLEKKLIYRKYLKSWFPLDLFASFPFELIVIISGQDAGQLGVLGALKLPRLLRLGRILKKLDKLKGATYVRVVYTLTMFLLVSHWFACVWWLIGRVAWNSLDKLNGTVISEPFEFNGTILPVGTRFYDSGIPVLPPSHGGVCMTFSTTRCIVTDNSSPNPWFTRIPATPLDENETPIDQKYFSALYWSLTMLMKSPWTGPDALIEKIFGCIIIFFAALLFAVLLTTVSMLYTQLTTAGAAKRDQMGTLVRFTTFKGVPKDVENKLLHYFDALHTYNDGQNDTNILNQLPYALRIDCIQHMYKDTLLQAPIFAKCCDECACQLLAQLQPQICLENDIAIEEKQVVDEVYFLVKGSLRVSGGMGQSMGQRSTGEPSSPDSNCRGSKASISGPGGAGRRGTTAFTMIERQGAIMGGMKLFGQPPRSPYKVVATKKTVMLRVGNGAVDGVLSMFPADKKPVITFIEQEHKQLTEAAGGAAKRRASVSQKKLDEPKPVEGATPEDAAAAPKEEAPAKPTPMTAEEMQAKMEALEKKMLACTEGMTDIKKNLAVLPAIFSVLKSASANAIAS